MRVIWSLRGGELALLEDAPQAGESDFGRRPPVYLAVKGCRPVEAIPGAYRYDELLEQSDNLLLAWEWIESEWIDRMRRKIGDELARQGRNRFTGEIETSKGA